jgi:serine protease Do
MSSPLQVRRWVAALFLAVAAAAGGIIGSLATAKTRAGHYVPVMVASASTQAASQVSFVSGFWPVLKAALPAVVNVSSSRTVRMPESPFSMDPFFRRFFGEDFFRNMPREQREHSLGSGVIVSPDGYILTNYHVVEKASDIKVSRTSEHEFKAKVVGTDSKTDLALLKIDEKNLPVLTFADSSKVHVGDFALAIGDPFGVGETATMGIVSATGRGGLGIETYEDFIQTDAAINPGNSGGALINVNGELIGINTAILSGSGGNLGIGFAIPANMARYVMEQILKNGKVIRGWLGVVIQPVTPDIAKAFGLTGTPRGALVGDVSSGSPAARAGLKKGDIILELNGQPITESRELQLKVAEIPPGTTVRLTIFRNGSQQQIPVTLGEMPANLGQPGEGGGGGERGSVLEGLSVDNLTGQIARELGLPPGTEGVVVTDVQPGSNAAEAGLRRGDVIQEVNRRPVTNVSEFRRAVRQAGNQPLLLLINRQGTTLFVTISPQG